MATTNSQPLENSPHPSLVLATAEESEPIFQALKTGDRFYEEGKFCEAIETYQEILEKNMAVSKSENLHTKRLVYRKIGMTYLKKADYTEAYNFLTQALELQENLNDGDLLGLCRIKIDIGEVLYFQGKYLEAHKYFEDSFETISKHYGEENEELVTCSNHLAKSYETQGKYTESLRILEEAVRISLKMYNSKPAPELARSYFLMGCVYECLAEYDQALIYIQKAFYMTEKLYGRVHVETAGCYNMFGVLYHDKHKYQKALENYNMALQIRLKVLGSNHPKVANSYCNIANVCGDLGDNVKALENYGRSLEINKRVFGDKHPNIATDYNNIATIYQAQNNYEEALKYYNNSLDIKIKSYGEDHPDLGGTYQNIGMIYTAQKKYSKAEEALMKSLKLNLKYLGAKHPDVISLYNNLGNLYEAQGLYTQAFKSYISSLRYTSIEDSLQPLADRMYNLGGLFNEMLDLDLSYSCDLRANLAYRVLFGKNHDETRDTMENLKMVQKVRDGLDMNLNKDF